MLNEVEKTKLYTGNYTTDELYDIIKKGVNIYELNGEKFYLFVHVCKLKDDNKKEFPFKKESFKTLCLSLIGKDNIGVYKLPFESIILGFEKINPSNIIHLFNSDSYTSSYDGTSKIQKIYKVKDLLDETYGYNEILYSQKNNQHLYPSYIVCFNEVRDVDLYFSKLVNLPIVKINTLNYRKNTNIEDYLEERYKSAHELENLTSYKML